MPWVGADKSQSKNLQRKGELERRTYYGLLVMSDLQGATEKG